MSSSSILSGPSPGSRSFDQYLQEPHRYPQWQILEQSNCPLPRNPRPIPSFLFLYSSHPAVYPPSIIIIEPVIQSDTFDERKSTAPIKSSGSPSLPMGKRPRTILLKAGSSKTRFVIGLLNTPGAIQLTLIL